MLTHAGIDKKKLHTDSSLSCIESARLQRICTLLSSTSKASKARTIPALELEQPPPKKNLYTFL